MKQVYNFDGSSIPMWVQAMFWLLYMLVFVYTFKKTLLPWHRNKWVTEVTGLFIFFFILYAVFYCINDDYFQYRDWINILDFSIWGKEKFYIYLILICRSLPFDYPFEVFRLIVWGGGILITFITFRIYERLLMPSMVILFLFVFYSNTFCYARASLAMAVYFLGIALYLNQTRWIMKILGIGIAISSVFFHHELLIGIAILPCLYFPLERKEMSLLSIFLLLFMVICISYFSSNLEIFNALLDNDDISSKLENFNEMEQGAFRLSTLIKYLNYYFPFFTVTILFWKKKAPHSVIGMYRITYGILMISVAFMIVFGLRSLYSYRIMYISMIPLIILIGYCYYNGYLKRNQFLIMIMISLLSNSSRFINAL